MRNKVYDKISSLYIFVIAFGTLPLLIYAYPWFSVDRIPEMLFWIVLNTAAEHRPLLIRKYDGVSEISLSFATHLCMLILLGIRGAILIAVITTLIIEILSKKPYYKAFFNTGQYSLTLLISGSLFYWLKLSPENITLDLVMDMPALIAGACSYYFLNVFFVSIAISLTTKTPLRNIFLSDFKVIVGYYLTLAAVSAAASSIYNPERPYIILLMVPPLIMIDQSLKRYYSLRDEAIETLKVLAEVIDARDDYTASHSARVAEYAKKIAQQMRLPVDYANIIEIAGKVHDLGKIGVQDHILKKKGSLNSDEMEQIEKHTEIGYRLLKNLNPYKTGAIYVLYHHERIDGMGYPHRISDNSIPLGAKILSVADSYDAMTSDRPYRKALTQAQAVDELKRCSGTQFDPKVVQSFIEVLKRDYDYKEE
ncbi:MAG: HD-GYP domain-containing protein [Clostridiales bacterium]|jgi:HD-GYP domain-containing protein (c-di-GMP phosphodiesterase class II)|nr:HD-GYP domain-containing protein [Clostridiales bacterium]